VRRNEKEAIAFGRVLRKTRAEVGMSQEKLANYMGIDRTYPSLMERGLRAPTITTICRLADAMRKQPSEMVARMSEELADLEREWAAATAYEAHVTRRVKESV
jgi:transcriptional regulator with XRE-family HTH domain